MTFKRFFDIFVSLFFIVFSFPIVFIFAFLIWFQDFQSPFYISHRVGKNGKTFLVFKLRSMIVNASSSGVLSTSSNDSRITPIGKVVRKFKLDELTQFLNVLIGDMSIVGPRPNVKDEVVLYSREELVLLSVRPGITDIASIVFSDEAEILAPFDDPDLAYNQYIRPYKSYLGLLYVNNISTVLDLQLIFFTFLGLFSRRRTLVLVQRIVRVLGAELFLEQVVSRRNPLVPFAPPGFDDIVRNR